MQNRERNQNRVALLALIIAAASLFSLAGCAVGPGSTTTFDRILSVNGPVRLEVQNGSGSVVVRPGTSGQVTIHGEVRASAWLWEDSRRLAERIAASPPIEQHGNIIHVGYDKSGGRSHSVNYAITVPDDTELQTQIGSGHLEARGIRGPVRLGTGSGSIMAENIHEDVQATTGSGGVMLSGVGGEVRATTGSGGIMLSEIHGEIRATTGSGEITITGPGGRVTARTGSGSVTVNGASSDLRAQTGSGHVRVEGNPAPASFWDLHTSSGGVDLRVPQNASFRLYARATSGGIRTDIPIVLEERSKHDLRARVGSGGARVEVQTTSGGIHIH